MIPIRFINIDNHSYTIDPILLPYILKGSE